MANLPMDLPGLQNRKLSSVLHNVEDPLSGSAKQGRSQNPYAVTAGEENSVAGGAESALTEELDFCTKSTVYAVMGFDGQRLKSV